MSELTKLIAEFHATLAKFEVIAKRMEEREKSIQVIAADPTMRDLPFPEGVIPPPLPEGETRWIYRGMHTGNPTYIKKTAICFTASAARDGCKPIIFPKHSTTSKPYENRNIYYDRRVLSPRVPPCITCRSVVPNRIKHMHDCRDGDWLSRPRFPGSHRRIARMPIRAIHRAKLRTIQPFVQNGAETNPMNLGIIKRDSIIGRDPILTYAISSRIVRREIKRRKRQAKWAKITSTLKFWT